MRSRDKIGELCDQEIKGPVGGVAEQGNYEGGHDSKIEAETYSKYFSATHIEF